MADIVVDSKFFCDNVEKVVLENVDAQHNHYKYYHLSRNKDKPDQFVAQWGRIGNKHQSKIYTANDFSGFGPSLLNPGYMMWSQMCKKLKKGYKIKTYKCFDDKSESYIEFLDWLGSEGVELFNDDDEIII
jgi:predicted DNA-binding WGR domain protein